MSREDVAFLTRLLEHAPQFDSVKDAFVWIKIHNTIWPCRPEDVIALAEELYRLQNMDGV